MRQGLDTGLMGSEPWLIEALPAPCPLAEEARAFEQGLYHMLWAVRLKRRRASSWRRPCFCPQLSFCFTQTSSVPQFPH